MREETLARNCRHLIPTTEKFNIKHDYDNAIPVSQHEKSTFKNVYRTKSGPIVRKTKRYIDEMWY